MNDKNIALNYLLMTNVFLLWCPWGFKFLLINFPFKPEVVLFFLLNKNLESVLKLNNPLQ